MPRIQGRRAGPNPFERDQTLRQIVLQMNELIKVRRPVPQVSHVSRNGFRVS